MNWTMVEESFPTQLVRKPRISRRFVWPSMLMLRCVPSCWGKSNGLRLWAANRAKLGSADGLVFAEFAIDLEFFCGELF